MVEKIGIIGLGTMGSLIVSRLLEKDTEMIVYDSNPDKMAPLEQLGIKLASSPAGVAEKSNIILSCVADEQTIEDVLIGNNGVINAIQSRSVVVDMSTSTPMTTKRVAELLEIRGADMIDAPVSLMVTSNGKDSLSFMVGGKEEVLERCRPLLSFLGTDIIHVGNLGSGHVVKAITTMMFGANLVAAAEIVGLGVKVGLDIQKMLEVINVSSGESFVTSNHYIKHILAETYDSNFAMGLMLQNIRISAQIAHETESCAFVATRIEEIYAMACYQGMALEDCVKIVPYLERRMGLNS